MCRAVEAVAKSLQHKATKISHAQNSSGPVRALLGSAETRFAPTFSWACSEPPLCFTLARDLLHLRSTHHQLRHYIILNASRRTAAAIHSSAAHFATHNKTLLSRLFQLVVLPMPAHTTPCRAASTRMTPPPLDISRLRRSSAFPPLLHLSLY